MKNTERTALALKNMTTGGFHLKDGRLYHDDLGELPSVKEIAAVVKQHPEEIGEALFNDAVTEFLPMSLNVKIMRRIVSGAATLADVEELTEARAEASRKVFSIGQELMGEAGEATAEVAAEIIIAFARGGYALQEEGGFKLLGGERVLPEHQTVTAALDRKPGKVAALLRSHCERISIVPKKSDVFSLSAQLAGFHHSALSLGLDELKTAMKQKRSAPWQNPTVAEDAFGTILRLIEEGKPVFEDEPFNMSFPDYLRITKALSSNHVSELAYLLANELHVRSGQVNAADDVIDRINAKSNTKDDIRALVEELGRAMKPKQELTYAMIEQSAQLLIQLAKKGYAYKGKSIVNIADTSETLPETDFGIIDRVLDEAPCALADLLFEELDEIPDEIAEAIEAGEAWSEDVFALCELLVMKNV